MNRAESKYFNTAAKMDKALLELLAEKDFTYITIKEICQKAGVHRSTFYLHYENLGDLLTESVEKMMKDFACRFQGFHAEGFLKKIRSCPLEELVLITPRYLLPYLSYIRDNQKLFRISVEHYSTLGLQNSYRDLFQHVFEPILERFRVLPQHRHYMMTFYLNGIIAVIMEWLENGCQEGVEEISGVLTQIIQIPNAFLKEQPGAFS